MTRDKLDAIFCYGTFSFLGLLVTALLIVSYNDQVDKGVTEAIERYKAKTHEERLKVLREVNPSIADGIAPLSSVK